MNEQAIITDEPMAVDIQQEEQNVSEQAQDLISEEAPQALPEQPSEDEPVEPEEPKPSEQNDHDEEIRSLRGQVAELTDALTRQREMLQRMNRECTEFAELFPDTPLSRMPSEVWEAVNGGVPLAAAYALYQVKQQRREQLAAEVNARNRAMSGGGVSGTTDQHLSPGEVRQMTAEQVHNNYSKILESMKLWS